MKANRLLTGACLHKLLFWPLTFLQKRSMFNLTSCWCLFKNFTDQLGTKINKEKHCYLGHRSSLEIIVICVLGQDIVVPSKIVILVYRYYTLRVEVCVRCYGVKKMLNKAAKVLSAFLSNGQNLPHFDLSFQTTDNIDTKNRSRGIQRR